MRIATPWLLFSLPLLVLLPTVCTPKNEGAGPSGSAPPAPSTTAQASVPTIAIAAWGSPNQSRLSPDLDESSMCVQTCRVEHLKCLRSCRSGGQMTCIERCDLAKCRASCP